GKNWIIDEEINSYINDDIEMVFNSNTNNPTETLTSNETNINIIKKAKFTNTIVAVDESFLDFIKEEEIYSAIRLIKEYDNLFIIKSMTKLFAIPGIRI
ncbi:aminotransferase class I/II-fold pyridoxal phosphate-dependent enzyme, partial [Clostridium sp. HCS.1]|uniref:aminotransferase class I/II-fold pyridoxal phosphate-dependent enzyme n=1 Tax=Clostridium sp. HCS.1 TaxID=3238594 RepID=UPI003A0FFF28